MKRRRRHRYQKPRLVGTVVDVVIEGPGSRRADAMAEFLFGQVTGLERRLSAFDPESELSRWRRGDLAAANTPISAELSHVMSRALDWQRRSDGLFNPLVGQLAKLWAEGEEDGTVPDETRLAAVAESIAEPCYQMIDGVPAAVGDCSALNLNAIAKGYVVDRAIELASERFGIDESGASSILVNAGGDIRHHGGGVSRIGIEDPGRPYDNVPPITAVELSNRALATSGPTRRGFDIGGVHHSHLLDPRTGQPAAGLAGVSIIALTAETADVVATVAALLDPDEAVAFIDQLPGVDGLVVTADGGVVPTVGWPPSADG